LAGSTRQLIVVNPQSFERIVVLVRDLVPEVLTRRHVNMQHVVQFDSV
jgi:hypothetical protein